MLLNCVAVSDLEVIKRSSLYVGELISFFSVTLDHIGNTVIQKLYERCSNEIKDAMLEKVAPYLASIGVHKNGTWAAQKIIDKSTTDKQVKYFSYLSLL